MKLGTVIKKAKTKLIARARKTGIYENFGQKEVRAIKDKFDYNELVYGTNSERKQADEINTFNNWCMDYDGRA